MTAFRASLEGALETRYVLRMEALKLRDEINLQYGPGKRTDRVVFPAEDLFFRCPHCGEQVDKRRLGDVMYHDTTLCAPDPDTV
jgi:hypothetical protein